MSEQVLREEIAEILVKLRTMETALYERICITWPGDEYPMYVKGKRKAPKIILKVLERNSGLLERIINVLEKIEASEVKVIDKKRT